MLNLTGETKDVMANCRYVGLIGLALFCCSLLLKMDMENCFMDGCTVNNFCILLWSTRAILQYVYLIKIYPWFN